MTTTSTPPSQAVQQDEANIRRVVQLYADGWGSGQTSKFEEAFHDDAWIFFTEADGMLRASRLSTQFRQWAATPDRATIRILEVRHSGDIANVLLIWRCGPAENTFLDLHNLLRIDGVWKITNKTATHISRAGDVPRI